MIENEQHYRVTKEWAETFAAAAAHIEEETAHLDPLLRRAMKEQYESQAEELREQLAEYDALRGKRLAVLELDALTDLPDALIHARKAAGLTQKALAQRLGLKEQQIQRYEATRYAGANLARLQAVAEALGVRIHERVIFPSTSADNGASAQGKG